MTLLDVKDLRKSFPGGRKSFRLERESVVAVDGVSFEVAEGETLALIGESGAGKSTTARLVSRLIPPDSGSVMFDGIDLLELPRKKMTAQRAKIQMIFQNPYGSLDPRIIVGDSVGEPLLVHQRIPKKERNAEVASLFERVGLSSRYMNRYPRELSGGQLQRASIARALTTSPKLIICDEPVAALDVLVRAQVLNLMKDIQHSLGIAYLFITHDLSLLRVLADRVCVMRYGEIVENGTIERVFTDPLHPYTRELLDAIPRMVPKDVRS